MAKKFTADLSVKGINNLIKQLNDYQSDLQKKCEEYVRQLAEAGIKVAQARIGESPLGKYVSVKTEISEEQAGCKAILVATGAVKQSEGYPPFNILLAVEFGAGIHYNAGNENPKADELGFGVGTFPGQIHAFEDGWYYWDEKKQEWRYTHGVKATMPMYSASVEIAQKAKEIARQVFGK